MSEISSNMKENDFISSFIYPPTSINAIPHTNETRLDVPSSPTTMTSVVSKAFYNDALNQSLTSKSFIELMEKAPKERIDALQLFGGLHGIAKSLHIELEEGIHTKDENDLKKRQEIFGINYIEPEKPSTFLELMWDAFQDLTVIVLTIAGFISLILGLVLGEDRKIDWIEGFSVLMAVFIVVIVTAANDYQKEKQFQSLNAIKEDETIKVIRDGRCQEISKFKLLVGDIVRIELGDILPADGILFDDKDMKIDESTMTGESMLVTKNQEKDPFLLSNTKVMEGIGKMLVLCVGENSQAGVIANLIRNGKKEETKKPPEKKISRKISSHTIDTTTTHTILPQTIDGEYALLNTPSIPPQKKGSNKELPETEAANYETFSKSPPPSKPEEPQHKGDDILSPLQGKLNKLTITIGKVGTITAIIVFIALSIRFSVEKFAIDKEPWQGKYATQYLSYFIIAITVLVVAIPEGLPLAVTIALAYSVRKMLKDNNLVRHLDACETMGSATTICSDKTGTLTLNRMTVMSLWSGGNEYHRPFPIEKGLFVEEVRNVLCEGIALNSTAEILPSKQVGGEPEHTGNKTECALLQFAELLGADYRVLRKSAVISRMNTFNSARKRMSVIVEVPSLNKYRLYVKGATEVILNLCTHYLTANGNIEVMDKKRKTELNTKVIEKYANNGMRTLCVAFRELPQTSFEEMPNAFEELETNLICIAIFGIEDPVRPEVPEAIQQCKKAGIVVRMITGDNINTAKSIAIKCGIIKENDKYLIMEGSEFRRRVINEETNEINQVELDKIWPRLRIMARSTPKDKYTLVSGIMRSNLKEYGPQVVAVTGDGTNDAPALKSANVGFAMGISGTSVAKDASDIILMDDNFTSIVSSVKWGRNVYDNISKFIQFQLTVNIVAISIAVIGSVSIEESPLSAVQLLWVNLIMDTFASLALATELPTQGLLQRKPYPLTKPLISRCMTKHILGQVIYQLAILLTMIYSGEKIFNIKNGRRQPSDAEPTQHYAMIFNTFVIMQLFNEYNGRKIHDEMNIFSGLTSNYLFVGISIFQFLCQALIVEFGGRAFKTTHLTANQWGICLLLGFLTLPIGALLRFINPKELPKWMAMGRDSVPLPHLRSRRGQELWVRGARRLRNQIRVINAFKQGVSEAETRGKYTNEVCEIKIIKK